MERIHELCLSIYEASNTMRDVGTRPPIILTTEMIKQYKKESSRKQGGSPNDSEMFDWINEVLDDDPGYMYLYHKTMQAKWHQYIECTSMRGEN